MSYQFEDDSALDELLNQQLDRRKQQSRQASNRPGTSSGALRNTSSQFRPSTASSSGVSNRQDAASPPAAAAASKSKLSAWLEGDSGASSQAKSKPPEPSTGDSGQFSTRPISGKPTTYLSQSEYLQRGPPDKDDVDQIENLLTAGNLQEMSKQRLIQLILERVVPRLSNLAQSASKHSEAELERLAQELQVERARLQVLELRHEQQLKLEQQKSGQLSGQLEARLEQAERELAKVMDSQREHLERLDEQYKRSLSGLNESYAQRMRDEKLRFDEMLRARDEMHKLEIESKLNVSCNLTKLDTIQEEWKQTLTGTIEQLEGHFKLVASLLDKQTLQVRGTNSELAAKTRQLCDQQDKFETFAGQLARVASQMNELLPEFAQSHQSLKKLQEATNATLESLDKKLELTGAREVKLDELRTSLESARGQLGEGKLQLALDTARVQLKEERLDETLRSAEERERAAASERSILMEQTSQAHIKRVNLDERAADLKEQNYTLHLLRKRLTHQREELIRAQVSFAEERKGLAGERAQASAESKRLAALRARAQRELDQLRRLQRSLVCSLCMGRLFGGDEAAAKYAEHQLELLPLDLNNNGDDAEGEKSQVHDGRLLGRQVQLTSAATKSGGGGNQKTMPNDHHDDEYSRRSTNDVNIDRELRLTELESGQLAAETKYIEQLLQAHG